MMTEIIINSQRYKANRLFSLMKLESLEKSQWIGSKTKNLKLQIKKLGTAGKLNCLCPLAFRAVAECIDIHNLASSESKDMENEVGIQNPTWYSHRLHDYLLLNYYMWKRIKSLSLQGSWN